LAGPSESNTKSYHNRIPNSEGKNACPSFGLAALANVGSKSKQMIDAWLRRYRMFRTTRKIVEQGLAARHSGLLKF
jgi:hypothetical protein